MKPSAEQCPIAAVPLVVDLCVRPSDVLHRGAELSIRTVNKHVEVVSHQCEGDHFDTEPRGRNFPELEKDPSVGVVGEDVLVVSAAVHHVVKRAGKVPAWWSCHSAQISS